MENFIKMKRVKTFPIVLINIGLLIFIENITPITLVWDNFWPTILITIGICSIINSFSEK